MALPLATYRAGAGPNTFCTNSQDFYNTHRPHRALNQAARFARCPMASPT